MGLGKFFVIFHSSTPRQEVGVQCITGSLMCQGFCTLVLFIYSCGNASVKLQRMSDLVWKRGWVKYTIININVSFIYTYSTRSSNASTTTAVCITKFSRISNLFSRICNLLEKWTLNLPWPLFTTYIVWFILTLIGSIGCRVKNL